MISVSAFDIDVEEGAFLVADALGVEPEDVEVLTDIDTSTSAWSVASGNYSSRFSGVGAAAVHLAAMKVAAKLDFGTVWVNEHLFPLASEMPHGGFKESGYGKDMSIYSMEEYTRIKHVAVKLS